MKIRLNIVCMLMIAWTIAIHATNPLGKVIGYGLGSGGLNCVGGVLNNIACKLDLIQSSNLVTLDQLMMSSAGVAIAAATIVAPVFIGLEGAAISSECENRVMWYQYNNQKWRTESLNCIAKDVFYCSTICSDEYYSLCADCYRLQRFKEFYKEPSSELSMVSSIILSSTPIIFVPSSFLLYFADCPEVAAATFVASYVTSIATYGKALWQDKKFKHIKNQIDDEVYIERKHKSDEICKLVDEAIAIEAKKMKKK